MSDEALPVSYKDMIESELGYPLGPSDLAVPQGNLNYSEVFSTLQGPVIVKTPNAAGRTNEMPFVEDEYRGVGFFDNPANTFSMRTFSEQAAFASQLNELDIPTPRFLFATDEVQVVEYLEGSMDLAHMWATADTDEVLQATRDTLNGLAKAHSHGLALGDRWGPNELITGDGVVFVDFDIAISGPETREFELASLLYFVSYFAQKGIDSQGLLSVYQDHLAKVGREGIYDPEVLRRYIKNYFEYFSDQGEYGWDDPAASLQFYKQL